MVVVSFTQIFQTVFSDSFSQFTDNAFPEIIKG